MHRLLSGEYEKIPTAFDGLSCYISHTPIFLASVFSFGVVRHGPHSGPRSIGQIKTGTYMVAIHQFIDDRHKDALANKYDPVKTPLRVEVMEDGQVIDITLPKELPD